MSGFGPPPGPPEAPARGRRASYLPPGGLGTPGAAAYRHRYAVTRTARPGIIPLAPLRLGDILDASAKFVRRQPGPVLGAAAIVNALAALPVLALVSAAFAGSWMRASGVSTVLDSAVVAPLLGLVGTTYATLVLTALLSFAVAEAALGRRRRIEAMWAALRPRLWTVLGGLALVILVATIPWALLVGMLAIASAESVPVLLLLGTAFGLLAIVLNVWLLPRLAFIGPAAVLEGCRLRTAFTRSWRLTSGRAWSVVGSTFVVLALAVLVFWVLQLPQWLAFNLAVDLFEPTPPIRDAAAPVTFALATLGASVIVTPFVAASNVLQYLDARMRKEGFDLALIRAATADAQDRG